MVNVGREEEDRKLILLCKGKMASAPWDFTYYEENPINTGMLVIGNWVARVQHAEIYLEQFYFISAFQSDSQPRNMDFFYQHDFFFSINIVEFSGTFRVPQTVL